MRGKFMTGVAAVRKPIDDHLSDAAALMIKAQLERAADAMLGATHQVVTSEPWAPQEIEQAEARVSREAAQVQIKYMQAMQGLQAQQAQAKSKTLDDFSTADLVMEMLKRGFAVMKMPEDGALPETLK